MPDLTSDSIDLSAYCARIGYHGETAPTLAVLRSIVAHHIQSIPFENLDVLLGRPILLTSAGLLRKLIHERRGGYCFEQNGLLLHVLESIGFKVTPMAARVRLTSPRQFTPPRTHLCLRVEIDGDAWLADVGIGAVSPTAPIRLDRAEEQPTLHEPRRILREDGKLFHQIRYADTWSDVYDFTFEEMPLIDRELANYFVNTHPKSIFRQTLMIARSGDPGIRFSLQDREFTHRRGAEIISRRKIDDPDELLELLAAQFNLNFPPGTRFGSGHMAWPT